MRFVPAAPFRFLGVLMLGAVVYLSSIAMPQKAGAEPEVVCSWCVTVSDLLGNAVHGFPDPSNRCTGSPPSGGTSVYCARCGGSSTCHPFPDPLNPPTSEPDPGEGPCNHIACGGENLSSAEADLVAILASGDGEELRRFLAKEHEGVSVVVQVSGGRIELIADCAPEAVPVVVALPEAMRGYLIAAVS